MQQVFVVILKFFLNQDCRFSFVRIGAEFGKGEDAWRYGLVGLPVSLHNHMAR